MYLRDRNRTNVVIIIFLGLVTGLMNMLLMVDRNYKNAMVNNYQVAKNSTKDDDHVDHDDTSTFQWDFLDLDQEVNCGADKCLFRSSSRTSTTIPIHDIQRHHIEDDTTCLGTLEYQTGYLVSKDSKHDESIFDGWKIAQYLTAKFGINHFFLGPPIEMELDKSRFESLFFPNGDSDVKKQEFKERLRSMDDAFTATVQKIAIAPKTSRELRLLSSTDKIVTSLEELLDGFRAERGISEIYNSSSHQVLAAAQECGFFEQLNRQVLRTIELLHCEPLMVLDFQFILDTSGTLYHLDFDRVLSNQGGLRKYNQTHFDDKIRSRLKRALRLLGVVREWIQTKLRQVGYELDPTSSIETNVCKRDWEAEETLILAATNLPCLATERVAIARHTVTSTMANYESSKIREKGDARLRHPLLVALLRRVIEAGFYDTTEFSWNCNVFGDRVQT